MSNFYQLINNVPSEVAGLALLPIFIWHFFRPFWTKKEDSECIKILIFIIAGYFTVTFTKGLLRIPHPNPNYTHTFALPSGHTFMFATFVTGFLSSIAKKMVTRYFIVFSALTIEGVRVCATNHHTPIDAVTAILLFIPFFHIMYYKVLSKKNANYYNLTVICVTAILITIDFMSYWAPTYKIQNLSLVAKYGLYILAFIYLRDLIVKKQIKKNR